jgi:hypothetical protein
MPRTLPVFLLAMGTVAWAQSNDLLLKGGHLIDPPNNLNEIRDLAVKAGKAAAVTKNLPASGARTPGVATVDWDNAPKQDFATPKSQNLDPPALADPDYQPHKHYQGES